MKRLLAVFVVLLVVSLSRSLYIKSTETTKIYNITESYNDIKIEVKTFDINVYLSNNNENKIVYVANKKVDVESKIVDGVLIVAQKDSRKFYDKLFDWSSLEEIKL